VKTIAQRIYLTEIPGGLTYRIRYEVPDAESIWNADIIIHNYALGVAIVRALREHHGRVK
jgi:hypothetical protein